MPDSVEAYQLTSFETPIAAVVHGASRGLGLEFVRQLVGNTSVKTIVATCRNPSEASDLTALAAKNPERLVLVPMDVTDDASVAAAAQAASRALPRVDLMLNCAGVLHDASMQPERKLADIEPRKVVRSFEVNALGTLLVAKHFRSLFSRDGRTVLASLSARVGSISDNGFGGWYSYRASKAALNMIVRNLSIELARSSRGVICVALHPGTVDTDLSKPFQRRVPPEKLFTPERAVRQLLRVVDGLRTANNGSFLAWDGQVIPW